MSLRTLLIGLSLSLLAVNACKTPNSQSALRADGSESLDDETFFADKANCQARQGLRLGGGMEITAIDETGYADVMGLKVGDVVLALNGEKVTSPSEFEKTCLDIGAKRPALWRYGITRDGRRDEWGGEAVMECDYLTMVGCAPVPDRAGR